MTRLLFTSFLETTQWIVGKSAARTCDENACTTATTSFTHARLQAAGGLSTPRLSFRCGRDTARDTYGHFAAEQQYFFQDAIEVPARHDYGVAKPQSFLVSSL